MNQTEQTAIEKKMTEVRDHLKREQATLSFRAGSRDERELIVREYAEMIDRLYPAKRFYIGPKVMPEPSAQVARIVLGSYTTHTPIDSHWRKLAIAREYPNIQF